MTRTWALYHLELREMGGGREQQRRLRRKGQWDRRRVRKSSCPESQARKVNQSKVRDQWYEIF